jgi:hypothetical protein
VSSNTPRADSQWIPDFSAKYAAWLPEALPLIRAHDYAGAFKTYPFPAFEQTPWSVLTTPVAVVRLGVVTTAGLYRPGIDRPFPDTEEGEPGFLTLPSDTTVADLDVAHSHIPRDLVRADPNVVLPLELLRALVREGMVGSLAPRIPTLVGYQTRADVIARDTAPAIAAMLAQDQVGLALVVPV